MKEYFSTLEAAKICNVSRFSIINWTKKGILKSCATPGGHRRIFHDDLMAFVKTYGVGLESNAAKGKFRDSGFSRCWQYHQKDKKVPTHNCNNCVVFLSDTKKCFTLRDKVGHKKIFCKTVCADCDYYKKVHSNMKKKIN